MTRKITSEIIGPLRQDDRFSGWWESAAIAIPFFDGLSLPIVFMDCEPEHDTTFVNDADQALVHFLKLDASSRNSISALVYQNCKDFFDAVGWEEADADLRQIKRPEEIWKHVHPTQINVTRRPYKEQDMYVMIECECDWEQEHGLQLVFRQGKQLTRVSEQDGHITEADAYGKPDTEDALLSAFNAGSAENTAKSSDTSRSGKTWWKILLCRD